MLYFSCLTFLNEFFQRSLSFFSPFFHYQSPLHQLEEIIYISVPVLFPPPIFALNVSERNCLWPSNSGYLRLLCNDELCKSIANFHFIDKAVCRMNLKALVLTTHTVSMENSEPLPINQKIKSLVSKFNRKQMKDQLS